MKTITFRKHIIYALVFCSFNFSLKSQTPPPEPRFKTFPMSQAFTAITCDGNKNVWAGTDKLGIFFLNQTIANSTFTAQTLGTSPVIGTLRIQSMAADKTGNVWVAHGGSNFSSGGGGVERINIIDNSVQHLSPDRDAKGLGPFFQRDGLGTLNAQQVVVDPNNKVWIAHRYHDLTVLDLANSQYIVTPGTFSYRNADAYDQKFQSVGTWKYPANELPYPAYTFNPKPNETAQTRSFNAISADKNIMWASVAEFIVDDAAKSSLVPRLLLYDCKTNAFIRSYTATDAKFNTNSFVRFNGVYANNDKGTWVTTVLANNGFSVFKDSKWVNVNDPQLIPPATRFNRAAIWGDSTGRVYLGTNNGLIVYDGYGPVGNIKSYKLYTKTVYDSPYSVNDTEMLSNNIIAGATEAVNSPNFSWIATDAGVMRSFLSSDVIVYHVDEKKKPNEDTEKNYLKLAELKSKTATYSPKDSDKPIFAVDGTTSSIIRYKTNDFDAFYEPNSNYKVEITKGGNAVNADDTLRYGKLTIKDKNIPNYKDKLLEDGSKYVDFIFRHPTYIDANDFVSGKNYVEFDLFVSTKNSSGVTKILFNHPIRFSLPPVLLGHGVWSDVKSLDKIENFLVTKAGYSPEEIIKVWKPSKSNEVPFPVVSNIIPDKIKDLIKNSLGNKTSAGKVSVVVHSRGGLYTRAYIEGIDNSPAYNDDINSLITLNTPHKGSQFGNMILDNRVLPNIKEPIKTNIPLVDLVTNLALVTFQVKNPKTKISDIIKLYPAAAEKDSWGAKNLTVENDVLSDANIAEARFVKVLNEDNNRKKLKNIPIHAIAGTLNICEVSPLFCNGTSDFTGKIFTMNPWAKGLFLLNKTLDKGVSTLNNFLETKVFNNEKNDAIVPYTSMTADLKPQFVSSFSGLNLLHIDVTIPTANLSGVTGNNIVHDKILELLKQNFKLSSSNFTLDGLPDYNALTYNLFPLIPNVVNRQQNNLLNDDNIKMFVDPNSFTANITSGSEVSYNIYQENIDDIVISYDFPGIEDSYLQEKNSNLAYKNTFTFTPPKEFFGKFSVTAYGFNKGILIVQQTVEPIVQLPANITLQSIKFNESKNTILEKSNYPFQLLGTYSDGVERIINDLTGIAYTTENSAILQLLDTKTIKGLLPGQSSVTATIGTLTTTLNLIVEQNPVLQRSLITNYYSVNQNTGPINLKWETYQEYNSKKFILERSLDKINFTQINEQLAKGTIYTPNTYTFNDNTDLNVVYYRLRLLNSNDVEVYSQTIQVSRGALSINNLNIGENKLLLYPNPLTSRMGTLSVYSFQNDEDASLKIYDVTGKLIYSKKCSILSNTEQKINFEMPSEAGNGIYLVQLQTKEFTKTVKLVVQ